jgi:hypothetical protein
MTLIKKLCFEQKIPSQLAVKRCASHTRNQIRELFLEQKPAMTVKSMRIPYHGMNVPNRSMQRFTMLVSFLSVYDTPMIHL